MSKLGIEQKTVKQLLGDNKADFLIPDYQRPYAWEEKECQTLWDDIFTFAFPDNDCNKFDRHNDEYFLGPIVTFQTYFIVAQFTMVKTARFIQVARLMAR